MTNSHTQPVDRNSSLEIRNPGKVRHSLGEGGTTFYVLLEASRQRRIAKLQNKHNLLTNKVMRQEATPGDITQIEKLASAIHLLSHSPLTHVIAATYERACDIADQLGESRTSILPSQEVCRFRQDASRRRATA